MNIKIFRSPYSAYYKDEISDSLKIYTDEYLSKLKHDGFNAIWLRAILRESAHISVINEYGLSAAKNQETLNLLSLRCNAFGIKVYLYFNEPLTHPQSDLFWESHPELKGTPGNSLMDGWKQTWALCSSNQKTIDFLQQGMADLFGNCPGIGGIFLINRSEHHTHCFSHTDQPDCPLCKKRNASDVIVDIINAIAVGVHSVASDADVIAWNWSWPENEKEIISKLNPKIILLLDFERGGEKIIAGEERYIDEYSLSYSGPSKKFKSLQKYCDDNSRKVYAKLQIGTTHELATVRNLPLMTSLLKKVRYLKDNEIQGALCCWNFGNFLSLNTFAFNQLLSYKLTEMTNDQALLRLADDYFYSNNAPAIVKAWKLFEEAFNYYPFCVSFLYLGPINYILRYPFPRPGMEDISMQRSWIPLKIMGTRLTDAVNGWQGEDMSGEASEGQFDLKTMVECLNNLSQTFLRGLNIYQQSLSQIENNNAEKELANAKVINFILQSTYNTFYAYSLVIDKNFDKNKWEEIKLSEICNLKEVLPHMKDEKELGYHSEAHEYFYNEKLIKIKLNHMKSL